MSYLDEIAKRIYNRVAVIQEVSADPDGFDSDELMKPLYRIYAVLCLAKGDKTTNKDVHNAWSAWVGASSPNHPSLVPFDDLEERIQQLDTPYRDAIHEIALEDRL